MIVSDPQITIEDILDPECSPAQVKTRAEGPTLEVRVATLARKVRPIHLFAHTFISFSP
jgi:hypothetical protein